MPAPAGHVMAHHTPAHHHAHRHHRVLGAFAATLGLVALAAVIQFGGSNLLGGRVLPGVTVAGERVGGLTRAQAAQRLTAQTAAAKVDLELDGKPVSLTPVQVGASYDVATTVDQAMAAGRTHRLLPVQLWSAWRQGRSQYAFTVNRSTEQAEIAKLIASNQPAQDATVVVTNGVPAVQPDKAGRGISPSAIADAVTVQLADPSAAPTILQPQNLPARITAADAAPAAAKTQQLIATLITITYNGTSYTPTAAQMGSWVTYTPTPAGQAPGLTPQLSNDAIKQYLATIAPHINVAAVAQRVNVLSGVSTQVAAGQNGTALDADTLANQIAAAVTAKTPLTTPAPTTTVPFKTIYNNTIAQPYAQYIEVNLSSQHLWAYQDHQVVYDSPVTSGATGAGFPTATGMFSIQAKQTNRHLIGIQYGPRYNYDVFVQYWMPFFEGYGLHDASWRHGNFGGQDYYYGGSHGCVNLPLATAAWLYNWDSVGTPVWVHT